MSGSSANSALKALTELGNFIPYADGFWLHMAGRHPQRVSKVILQNAVTGGRYSALRIRVGAHLVFNRWVERWTWAAVRSLARLAPLSALKVMMGSLSSLDPGQVVATMNQDQQQAALALLLASRSGSGFLHDFQHHCGDLRRITAPTLIIESKYDGSIDATHANYAADNIPNAELFISPAESHLMWFSSHNTAIEEKMRVFLQTSWALGSLSPSHKAVIPFR